MAYLPIPLSVTGRRWIPEQTDRYGLLLKSVEFDDDVALLLSVAGLVMGTHVTSESEIGRTDSAALRTSWTCLRLCGSCVTGCTSFFRGSDPAV